MDTIENLEKSYTGNIIQHIKIKGAKGPAASIIEMTEGVKEITAIDAEGNDFYAFTIAVDGDPDAVRNSIMSELLKNNIQIVEIFTEKPDLEAVFSQLINAKKKDSDLADLLDELGPAPDEDEDNDNDKEADE